ncbi:nitrate- and nitrite sensing domain-containing protein [Amycolatopsis sp. NBC_00345]|uniref:sensor histidine kinase n=1 Tax=Amycolatopsis sp. NBC_00345 TaxID=2975955 RepID=UPI002E263150
MRLRSRLNSIRLQMLAIVLIPSVTLAILGVGAAGYLVDQGATAQNWATTMQATVAPGTEFTAQVEAERRLSLLHLAGDSSTTTTLPKQRDQLNTALAGLQSLAAELSKINPAALEQGNAAFAALLDKLVTIRQGVDNGQAATLDVYGYYNQLTQVIKLGLQGVAKTAPDPVTAVEESTAVQMLDIADSMSRASALAVPGATKGGLTADEYQEFAAQAGLYRTSLASLAPVLSSSVQNLYQQLTASPEWRQLQQVENVLLAHGAAPGIPPLPVTIAQWQDSAAKVNTRLLAMYSEQHHYAEGFAAQAGQATFVESLIAGAIVLLITVIAVFVATRLSTRVVRRLKRLRAETLELSEIRLPGIVDRLRDGEKIDVDAEVPPLDYGSDELGQVAEAFNKAQHTAVAAAAQEAETRDGVRSVFLNIAHRSQIVVRRQLEVLDKAERDQEDPEQLEVLFQLDHLAIRARRNAENLIILGGERPGRQWRNPVPLVEIVRSAIGETENYRRVQTGKLPELSISGAAVADLIHLLAELVENATSFSPPDSRVEVRGNIVGKGVVVEVEDQGLGMASEERERVNTTLRNPPDFRIMALSEEARLGLFVISQLATRHGISVSLVDSAYGGIRAIVLIRTALVAERPVEEDSPSTRPAPAATDSGPRHQAVVPNRRTRVMSRIAAGPESAAGAHPRENRVVATEPEAAPVWPGPGDGHQAPAAGSRAGVAQRSTQAAPGRETARKAPAAEEKPAPSAGDSRPSLPRRRRQASLAPQLAAPAESPRYQADSAGEDAVGAAERVRDRMSALQSGTRRGRGAPV